MTIVQIFSHVKDKNNAWVLGLGDDAVVYYWNYGARGWFVWGAKK